MPFIQRKRRFVRGVVVAGAAVLFGIQLVPVERANPPAVPELTLAAHTALPANVRAALERGCRDCHSYSTEWPWYSRVAPSSWLVADHVNEGREHLNFSEWGRYTTAQRADKLGEICDETREGNMPLTSYLLLHPAARLTSVEIDGICSWTSAARSTLRRSESYERASDRERR